GARARTGADRRRPRGRQHREVRRRRVMAAVPAPASPGAPPRSRGARPGVSPSRLLFFAVFLGLPLLLYLVIVVWPVAQAVYYSLTDWRGLAAAPKFISLVRACAPPGGAAGGLAVASALLRGVPGAAAAALPRDRRVAGRAGGLLLADRLARSRSGPEVHRPGQLRHALPGPHLPQGPHEQPGPAGRPADRRDRARLRPGRAGHRRRQLARRDPRRA